PGRRVIAIGLCSGGWLGFRAAREGLDADGVVCVNPPLYLVEGAGGAQWLADTREIARYQQSLGNPSKWAKALRGAASYSTATRLAAAALRRRVAIRVGIPAASPPAMLAGDLEAIAARCVLTLFVFSAGDHGLDYFRVHA